MAISSPDLDQALELVADLEEFVHELFSKASDEELLDGEDLVERAARLGVSVPSSLAGEEIRYTPREPGITREAGGRSLVLVRPGRPDMLDVRIGCTTIRGHRVCLECGWIWCRIVIYL